MTRGVFTAATAITAAGHNEVTDPPRAYVYNSANISITVSGTAQALTFNTEAKDSGPMHDTGVNPERLTVPSGGGGWYEFGGCVQFAANATGYRMLYVRLNGGATILALSKLLPGAATSVVLNVTGRYPLAAGDYIELMAQQTSGGALNAETNSVGSPSFWASWLHIA